MTKASSIVQDIIKVIGDCDKDTANKIECIIKDAVPIKTGHPAMYNTPVEMQTIIDKYFDDCDGEVVKDKEGNIVLDKYSNPVYLNKKPATVTGLCLALGFTSRQALINYQGKEEFVDTVTRAKLKCQEYAESRLYDNAGANGAKFSLGNNFGWIERQEITNRNIDVDMTDEELQTRIDELIAKRAQTIYALPTTTYSISTVDEHIDEQDKDDDKPANT